MPHYIIGIDEVGRGALAGPVVVAAVMAERPFRLKNPTPGPLKDSKKLSAKKRDEWFDYLTRHPGVKWVSSRVTPCVIDRINISRAADRAALRTVQKLLNSNPNYPTSKRSLASWITEKSKKSRKPGKSAKFSNTKQSRILIYLDGGLSLPHSIAHRAIVRGDEKVKAIAASSIIAKVIRDRAMARLHKKEPRYRFDVHKGYGTRLHKTRLAKFGYSDHHRKSFHFHNSP